jgi:hypothetical protein
MRTTIMLELRPDDAEPYLREAAEEAAKLGAWVDYLTRKCGNLPCGFDVLDERKKEWRMKFLRAKRIVEAFGVEYEQTSEEETMTVDYPTVGTKYKIVNLGPPLGRVRMGSGGSPDFKHPYPSYRSGVHAEACRQAALRVVRRWRETIA